MLILKLTFKQGNFLGEGFHNQRKKNLFFNCSITISVTNTTASIIFKSSRRINALEHCSSLFYHSLLALFSSSDPPVYSWPSDLLHGLQFLSVPSWNILGAYRELWAPPIEKYYPKAWLPLWWHRLSLQDKQLLITISQWILYQLSSPSEDLSFVYF